MTPTTTSEPRRLGLVGATAVGVGSMIGAGLFVALPSAVDAAGRLVWVALAVAAVVAACNAWSSARLAMRYPVAGGTYVYGRERLGPSWGVVAGAAFVVGKTASLAVMALAIGRYALPVSPVGGAVLALALVTAVNLAGIQRSAAVLVGVVALVLAVLVVVAVRLWDAPAAGGELPPAVASGALEAAGLLFFAFAGFARLATLGGDVRRPARTIPRAVALAVVVVTIVYAASLGTLLHALGPALADASAPFVAALDGAGAGTLAHVVAVVAVVSAGGALLSLGLGVSRTTYAMAADGVLLRVLSRTSRAGVPWVAELVTAAAAAVLVLTIDLTATLVVSSACVLVYYAVANASAWTLGGRTGRAVAGVGLVGCLVLTASLVL